MHGPAQASAGKQVIKPMGVAGPKVAGNMATCMGGGVPPTTLLKHHQIGDVGPRRKNEEPVGF